ncbi:MAG: hypothetical protein HC915_09215 [Anaerolineae bacterium]|nr:hypothetical protein [Anaerolineae bacterium]
MSSNSEACQINREAVEFTAANWEAGITVRVSVPYTVLDAEARRCLLVHGLLDTSTGEAVPLAPVPELGVVVEEIVAPEAVLEVTELTFTEGEQASYQVRLSAPPFSPPLEPIEVSVTPIAGRCEVSLSDTRFTVANWETGLRVTVSVEDDAVVSGERSCLLVHLFRGLPTAEGSAFTETVTVTILEDDAAGLVLDPAALEVVEGSQARYQLRLLSEPSAPVQVEVTSSTPECSVEVLEALTAATWEDGLTLTVITADNFVQDGARRCELIHTVESEDASYAALNASPRVLEVAIADDDSAALDVSQTRLTLGEGEQRGYALRLSSQPLGEVVVTVSSERAECAPEPSRLVFSSETWNNAQDVLVRIAEDDLASGNRECVLSHALRSNDPTYNNIPSGQLPSVRVEITDPDEAGVNVGTRTLVQTEGLTNSYTLRLESQPREPVRVEAISSAEACQVTVEGPLTAQNWQAGVTISVTSADDARREPERTCEITHRLVSNDSDYNLAPEDLPVVQVTVQDDDRAEVRIQEAARIVPEGTGLSYTVTLGSEPPRRSACR